METSLKQPAWLNTLRVVLIISFVGIVANIIEDIVEFVKNTGVFSFTSYNLNLLLSHIILEGFNLFLLWQFYRLLPVFKSENLISTKVYQQINRIAHTVYYLLLPIIVFHIILFGLAKNDSTYFSKNVDSYINHGAASYRFGHHFGELFRVVIINNIALIIITAVLWLFTRVFQRAILLQLEHNLTI
ncbi:MAG: hypothetical protein ABI267_08800 [Ginsengibacter sp.]